MAKLTVLVLFGGRSAEHEVSIVSASSVINGLNPERYNVIPVMITKQGQWLDPADSAKRLKRVKRPLSKPRRKLISSDGAPLIKVGHLRAAGVDVVFPVLHGPYGEDGTVQGLLELADVPYVGSGVSGSAVGMDKDILKRVFRDAGLPVVDFLTVLRSRWRAGRDAVMAELLARFTFPVFVKPACLGSSVGIRKATSRKTLRLAMDYAARFDTKLVIEQGVKPLELECAVLGNDEPQASCVGQIVPVGGFYDYKEKYLYDRTKLLIPARVPAKLAEKVRRLSVLAYRAADCAGLARVDFLLDKTTGRLYVSELNTMPGFTSISMYPKMWERSGIPFGQLLDRLIAFAIERHADRASVRVDR